MSEKITEKITVLKAKHTKSGEEKTIRIDKKRLMIGSSTSSDVYFQDSEVSAVHAILEMGGLDGKPVIYDLASDNGVKVNGTATVQATLADADKVQVGSWVFTVGTQNFTDVPKPVQVMESFGKKLFVTEKEDLAPLIISDGSGAIEIFDRRPESKQCLQVVMFYRNTILDVEHFVEKKKIVIGPGKRDDFSIPPFLGADAHFELVTQEGSQYYLHLHPKMQGVVSRDGKLVSIAELVSSNSGSKTYPLSSKDFAKVTLNDVSFYMNHTAAPPKLKKPKLFESDPFFFKVWFSSLAVTGLMIFGLRNIVVNPVIEIEQLPERIATIIYEPKYLPVHKPEAQPSQQPVKPQPPKTITIAPKKPKEDTPKNGMIGKEEEKKTAPGQGIPNKKPGAQVKASGQEGAGAKAKGDEGTRGKQNAKPAATAQTKAARPGEGKPSNAAATNKGKSETQDLGMVDVFKSNKGTLSKVLAGGKGASNNAEKLEGYSGFTTQGAGGLGAASTGSGGGGNSLGLGGLADKGAGGGKKGTGLGALGSGGNILGGSGKITIESGGGGDPVVMGSIDIDAIWRALRAHDDEFKYCYEREANAENPDLSGKVNLQVVLGGSGAVTKAYIGSTTLKNANTENCIIDVVKRIAFPPVRGGGIVEFGAPFVFKPHNK